ncbi:MAG: hypothetical protein H7201_14840 [Candidatus Saccharibacteria bacterium]|nr:hypothetical protein [Microbacteriaceae bacterium]
MASTNSPAESMDGGSLLALSGVISAVSWTQFDLAVSRVPKCVCSLAPQ